ncbi:MAG: hypothetical protein BWY30_00720 [Tenericutes bacterium ADurb.Bin239]|jgi:hypothetical protein|nr:MAG: hypothetical protein BWY30_00720 [Tenericutes bacterium ADurb.Bin239]
MKRLTLFLEQIFDYLVLSVLLVISLALIVPFTFALAVMIAYCSIPLDSRSLKGAFRLISENKKQILLYSLISTILLVLLVLNVNYFTFTSSTLSNITLFMSWIILVVVALFTMFAPIVIFRMHVTNKELMQNITLLILRGNVFSLLLLAVTFGLTLVVLYYPLIIIPLLYFYGYLVYLITNYVLEKLRKGGTYATQE